jgi:hypothetical protein
LNTQIININNNNINNNNINNNNINNNNNSNNKMNPNLDRRPTEEDLQLNQEATQLFLELETPDNPLRKEHFKRLKNEKDLKNQYHAIRTFSQLLRCLEQEKAKPVNKRSKKYLRKHFNTALNSLDSKLTSDTPLRFLLPVDDQLNFMKKRIPTEREHVDFFDTIDKKVIKGNSPKEGFVYHPQGLDQKGLGGRVMFESPEHFLSALRAGIDKCNNWRYIHEYSVVTKHEYSVVTKEAMLSFPVDSGDLKLDVSLKIPFIGTDFWDYSDSARIAHILCNGNPPKMVKGKFKMTLKHRHFKDIYPLYAEYLELVEEKIINIINESHNVPECPYRVIPCCRTEPYTCNSRNIALTVKTKKLTCCECKMDLCSAGCGRVYHGEFHCDSSFDALSEEFLANYKKCPNFECQLPTEKIDGCNHMTCRCGTEWCWICCQELPRNERRQYSTYLHFSSDGDGIGVEGGCNQFGN